MTSASGGVLTCGAVAAIRLSTDSNLLAREGHVMSPDRTHRLWRQAGLQVPRPRPRHRVAIGRPRPLPPTAPNHVWAYDFVFDRCANNQRLNKLTIGDE